MSFKSSKVGSDVPDGNLSGQRASCSLTKGGLRAALAAAAVCIAGASLPAFAERTVSVESIDPATREIALAFGGTAEAEEAVMIAYGDKDYGTDFAAWPCRRHLGTIAADATGATFTIPSGWAVDPGGKYFRIFTGTATALPYDSEVEYIQGTGTENKGAYIFTGMTPLCTDKVEFEVMPRTVSGNQSIFCARSGMSDNSTFTCFTIGSTFRFDRITSGAATSGAISTKRYSATADYGTGAVNIKCDGVDFYTGTMPTASFTVGGPLVLFSSYNTYTASTGAYATWNNGGTYNLYRFKLAAADGTVKLDLVPVIKNSVAYLYDKVSGKLLGKSGGSGDFGHGIVMSDGVSLAASGVSETVFAGRTMSIAAFNAETGAISLKFSGVSLSAQQTLVVAFGNKDCGESLASWDANKRFPLGTVAANATSGTYTLPPLAIASGTFFRLFLVDSVTVDDYDEEVAWIQPETLGAYMNTGFVPSQNPKAEFKMNMDGKSYSDTWAYVMRANTGWPSQILLAVDSSGQVRNMRVGDITFKAVSTTADHVITLSYQYSDRSSNSIKIDGKTATPTTNWNNYNQNQTVKPANPVFLWSNHTGDGNFSAVKIYYIKWMNTSGTVEANFIPVKKDGEYCLYNKNNSTLIHNAGAEGTAFKGGAVVGYPALTPSGAQSASAANTTFAKSVRTMELTGLDETAGTATLAFAGDAVAAQTLVVAWGDRDYGTNLDAWPYAQHAAIGTVAADATEGTFTLPAEALVSGNCYRFFLGDGIVEGLEWIQPAVEGAYIRTDYTPNKTDMAEFKFNMDSQTYSPDGYRTIIVAGSGWSRTVRTGVNSAGWMDNVRVGTIRFAEKGKTGFSSTEDHVVKLNWFSTSTSPRGNTSQCFTIDGKNGDSVYYEYTDGGIIKNLYNTYNNIFNGANTPLKIWANDNGESPSMVKLYYMRWTTSDGTTLTVNYIPVKRNGEYCLYDLVNKTFAANCGEEGTSFTGKSYENYVNAICFANVQTAATGARLAGPVELTALDYGTFDATLAWPALPAASTLWVVFSGRSPGEDPGAFNLADWDECVKLDDIAAGSEGGTYNLGDPSGKKRSSMRFIIATAGSTAEDIVPLNVSGAYRFKKEGLSVFIR